MQRFICIHGHFYQPPRENPWLEAVELQDSAAPDHDWNERITAECYGPNATARIMDGEGRISQIVSNYSRISFNFGPTVLAWLKENIPEIHTAIIEADRQSRKNFSGHGSAMAQVYNHVIMPLACPRDKYTQVFWGIRDFEFRFGRKPEGLWLPETAADTETLLTLAEQGIKFTVLSPFQASRTREIGKRGWRDVNGGRIDPTRPYLCRLPGGKSITLFFYDAPVSQAVAFENLLNSGERLAERLLTAFSDKRGWEQLVHIATDGESYGHHHRHGEMALAYALRHIETQQLAKLTIYAEHMETHPPTWEVKVHEKSAWSCSHGVGRWMANCGCNSGGHADWNQEWRQPLRFALDWLRDAIAPLFEAKTAELLHDPWQARNNYIDVVLDRSPDNVGRYFDKHARRPLNEDEQVTVLKLMEMQRHSMLMYTSCGWFFDEVSGLETVQVVQYAARAIQLARELLGQDLEEGFLERFQGAKSNIPENCDGRCIYEKFVKPAMVDREKATAHYAISSLFENFQNKTRIYSYTFVDEERKLMEVGKTKLAVGRVCVVSEITWEKETLCYAILYMGEHNLVGGVAKFTTPEDFSTTQREITESYEHADFPETIRRIDRHFGQSSYSLKSLFKDEQRRILNDILASTRDDLESRFRLIVERYEPLMKFLRALGSPLPPGLQTAADFVLHVDIRRELESERLDLDRLNNLLTEAQSRGTEILDAEMSYFVKQRLEQMIEQVAANPADVERIRILEGVAGLMTPLPIGLNLWKVQNTYWEMMQAVLPEYKYRAGKGDENAQNWVRHFSALGDRLGFEVKHLQT
jgi:alpha-amylase/alpha-mannosidase (GH57 family)